MTTLQTKVVKTTCSMCDISCGIDVKVENGKAVEVSGMPEHMFNILCVKGQHVLDMVYHPDRLLYPLKRTPSGWQRIGWPQVWEEITTKLKEIKSRYGGRSLVISQGTTMSLGDPVYTMNRFANLSGTPNFVSPASICFFPKVLGNSLVYGHMARANFRGSKCIVIWGANPVVTSHYHGEILKKAKNEGVKIMVVDPRKSPTSKFASLVCQLRPGTDGALALGCLNIVINEGLYDRDFVEKWAIGFDRLKEHVQQYTPERVSEITSVPVDTIREFARTYATSKPATIYQGLALDGHSNGVNNIRAIASLIALTGNLDIPGGNIFVPPYPTWHSLELPEVTSEEPGYSSRMHPIFSEIVNSQGPTNCECSAIPLAKSILTEKPYPIKALIVQGANPMATWPNATKLRKAFGKLELFIAIDVFHTDTTALADYVLPAASFLEQARLAMYYPYLNLVTYRNKAIEPLGECISDIMFWVQLGKRMGYGEYFPWTKEEEVLDEVLKKAGCSVKELGSTPRGMFLIDKNAPRRYEKEGFNTPSRKAEFYSEKLARHGYDPLPTYHEPVEGPISTPELYKKYPFIAGTGARVVQYFHSQQRNVKGLRKACPDPIAEIEKEAAVKLGIKDGDWVIIESPRGSIKMKAKFNPDMFPSTVWIPHGWSGESNANILTDDMARDPISGNSNYRSFLCRIKKAS